jgi:hypothetical protein
MRCSLVPAVITSGVALDRGQGWPLGHALAARSVLEGGRGQRHPRIAGGIRRRPAIPHNVSKPNPAAGVSLLSAVGAMAAT